MTQTAVFKGGEMQPLTSPLRTEGDGMENSEISKTEKVLKRDKFTLGDKLIYRPQDYKQYSPSPPLIVGKVVNLVPKNVIKLKKDTKILDSLKSKEPKFVPYEPYKAAVKSMIPLDKKNRLDRQMSKKHVLEVPSLSAKHEDNEVDSAKAISLERKITLDLDGLSMKNTIQELETERECFILELKTLKEENTQLESQLKFQAQVNGELKALLVAAVGEDLEVRVNHLTEDKLQLARALLNSAQKLSTHQEQTEWLAGQCEVWRSKFLASSLMVEELARWKAALTQKTTDLQEALKRLLEERRVVRESLLHTHKNLSMLRENFEHGPCRRSALSSSNIVDLSAANRSLGEVLTLQLLGGHDRRACREPDMTGLDASTWAERAAETLLSSPSPLLLSDVACSAVLGAAVAVGSHGLPASCCAHCSGEIKLV